MGKFLDLVKAALAPQPMRFEETWRDHFPLLYEAMFPLPGKASGTFASPRYSVTLFQDGGELKAVVGAKDGPRKLFMTLDGPEAALEQVELCIKSGKIQWRDTKEQE